ncbi:MAG TPA: MaoC family dehydratase [Candidatus Acidoferrum sp.]|nr:MaoC family dehydratase [Candidatus Acidoferrum sp.]
MLTIRGIADLEAARGTHVEGRWRTVTQAMIDAFADVCGDHQWIHVDTVRALSESPYKTTIAHGFLTLSLLSVMLGECFSAPAFASINYGFERIRFVAPVPSGARIRGRFALGEVRDSAEGAVNLTWNVEVEIEGVAKPALVATWIIRLALSSC